MKRLMWFAAAAAIASAAGCFGGVFADDYRTCSSDPDCHNGERCLMTATGAVCVTSQDSRCTSNASCPGGTACGADGACRTACDASGSLPCLVGQACTDAVCVGIDPRHDPSPSAAGAGGAGGAGAGGTEGGSAGSGASGAAQCSGDAQCLGGHCIVGQPPTCRRSCVKSTDCLSTEVCDAVDTLGNVNAFVCVAPAGTQSVGDACTNDSHCKPGSDCKNKIFCSKACKTDVECAPGVCGIDRCALICPKGGALESYCNAIGGACVPIDFRTLCWP